MGGLFKKPKAPKVVVPKQRMPVLNQESEEEKRRKKLLEEARAQGFESTVKVRNPGRKAGTMGS